MTAAQRERLIRLLRAVADSEHATEGEQYELRREARELLAALGVNPWRAA